MNDENRVSRSVDLGKVAMGQNPYTGFRFEKAGFRWVSTWVEMARPKSCCNGLEMAIPKQGKEVIILVVETQRKIHLYKPKTGESSIASA